jgi:hypothetical protein
MNYLINSLQRGSSQMTWLFSLITQLSSTTWSQLPQNRKDEFVYILGAGFINQFNSNTLITILLQTTGAYDLIIKGSYFYSLLKMLFNVFGYALLIPTLSTECASCYTTNETSLKLEKYIMSNYGAYMRRSATGKTCCESCKKGGDCCGDNTKCCENTCQPDCIAVDPCIYVYIKLFGELYPTLTDIMGGTTNFPPECLQIDCSCIPANYNCLCSLPEYLWRFNDYSYCKYLEYVSTKQIKNAQLSQPSDKVKYLMSL